MGDLNPSRIKLCVESDFFLLRIEQEGRKEDRWAEVEHKGTSVDLGFRRLYVQREDAEESFSCRPGGPALLLLFCENRFCLSQLIASLPCEKIQWRSWYKMPSKLHGCIGFLYKVVHKLAVSLCSFSQFSFPFNFQTANALVLKFGTLPLRFLFSKTLLAIFDIFFRSKVIHRFVPKNGPKMTCERVFQHNFITKANLKNPEQGFLVHKFYLLWKQKRLSLARPVFNKSDRIWSFFAYLHLFRHLKVIQSFQKYAKTLYFGQAFRQKKPFEDSPSGFKIRF